ncbi:MAG: hypothetical protein V8S76_02040 [Lachnospiraceae bacterium]
MAPAKPMLHRLEKLLPHPGGFVGVHQGVCLLRHLFFLGKGADDDKAFQPLLQEHPERAVCFLNFLVQSFQYLAERIGQQHHGRAAGEQNVQKTRLEPQNSGDCAQQAHQHSDQPGHDLGHAARHHGGIRGQAVHPLAGVHRRNRGIIAGKQGGKSRCLKRFSTAELVYSLKNRPAALSMICPSRMPTSAAQTQPRSCPMPRPQPY